MPKLRIYIPVLMALLSLAAAMTAAAADELKIVYNVGVAPLKFEDAASRPAGLFPDIWRLWARKAGKKVDFVKVDSFKESLQLLKDGKVDLHAGLFRTPEREEFLDYSEPLLALDYYIFTHPSVYPIKMLEKTSGFIVGIQKGGYTERFVRSKVPANRIAVYDRFQDLFRAALEGEIRVFVAPELSLFYYLKENYFTNIFEYDRDRPLFSQVYYTATRKGNPLLIQQVNDGLKAIGSQERKLLEDKWIVRDFEEIPREPAAAQPGKGTQVALSAKEQDWLAAHRKIVVGGEKDWAPFDFVDETGKYAGIANDYLKVIGEKLGIEVEIITGPSWNELLTMLRNKEIDVLPAIYHSKEREAFARFTTPYIKITEFIFSRSDNQTISSFADLKDKTIAVVKGYTIESYLRSNYPDYDLITAPTIQDALKKLIIGEADAFIGDIISTSYNIKELSLVGIKPIASIPFRGPNVHMAVRKDWPVLRGLLDKTLKAIPEREHDAIKNHWIALAEKKIEQSLSGVSLTAEEQNWVKQHPVIRVHNETASPPFNFVEFARPKGFSIDYMQLLAEKIGLQVEFVTGPSWDEFLAMMKAGDLDVMLNIAKTPERQEYLAYTPSYVTLTQTLYTRKDFPLVRSIEDLYGKRIAVPKGFYIAEMLKPYPEVKIVEVRDIIEAIHAVSVGKADALYDIMPAVNYLMNKQQITNLKVGGDIGIEAGRPMPLHLAVPRKNAVLAGILAKGMALVTDEEFQALSDKWLGRTEAAETGLGLTIEERAFLNEHPVIRVHNEKDWPPFNYFEYGSPRGLSIDYMNLVAEQLGIKVEYVTGPSWNEFLGMVKRKELDVMLNIVKTEDRMKYLLYTEPYIKNPNVIVSSQESPYETIEALFGKTVAFPKGFFYEEVLTKSFPQIKRLPVEDTLASLKAVTFGRADAALGEAAVMRTLINKNLLTGLRISGEVNIGNPDLTNLRLAVRDDWPLLQSALMKAMAAITPQEMNQIRQKWIGVDGPATSQETAVPLSYGRLIAYGIAVFLILSLLTWILIKAVKKELIAVNFGSRWFRGLVLAGLSFFVIVVCLLGWFTLERDREKNLEVVGENLTEILKIADDRLHLWVEQRTSFLKLLGRDPELVTLTKRLLAVTPGRESLLASDALRDTRAFFKTNKDIFANIGFFIINADHISIGSMRDTNIGTRNLISQQSPDLLRRAFEGDVLFVPPIESDVPLGTGPKADGAGNRSTKFFMGPIRDTNGQIIAVMTLRVDPSEDFSRVLTSFEMRKTFEIYAFSEHGELLSESRFDEQLRRIGLIAEGQQSAFNIAIRDPGVNLVKGLDPKIERSQQPLTRMALRAIQLKLDMEKTGQTYGHSKIELDTKGYRDYRGVPVFGAWLWNVDLGLGLATEIDVAKALSNYYQIRRTIFGVLGFTLFLSVGAVLLVLILGERTSRALMTARDNLEARVDERTAELQEKQEQLKVAEERSRLLLDSVGEGIFGVDLEGKVAFTNPAANRILGYEADELIGQDVHQKIHHSHADGSRYPKEACPMYLSHVDGTDHHVTDEVLWRKDGTSFPVEYTSMPLKKDDRVVGAVVTFMDIAERKKMETALLAERERLQKILDTSPVGVGISIEGVVRFANARFSELFYSKEGEGMQQAYVNPADREYILNELQQSGIVHDYELQTYGPKRETRDTRATFISTEYQGQTGILAWLVDLSGLKEAERELKAKFDELDRFRRLAIGREQKMIELKKEINEFLKETGNSEKYKIHGRRNRK